MKKVIGSEITFLDKIASTNDYANKLIENEKYIDGQIIVAINQSSGKGQQNNVWESEPGKNITCSIILKPAFVPLEEQFLLSKAISLGVRDFLLIYTNQVSIKWPNDIYIGDKKIAGILIENIILGDKMESSVIGIGININQENFSKNIPNPTSLKIIEKRDFNIKELANQLAIKINYWYSKLRSEEIDIINKNYLKHLYRQGITSRYKDKNSSFSARIINVENTGRLLLEKENGEILKYWFKEVEYLF
jgi:BirA family biotin operon repressor/biotin-[acetyl-CoA-carboxylase] ligase